MKNSNKNNDANGIMNNNGAAVDAAAGPKKTRSPSEETEETNTITKKSLSCSTSVATNNPYEKEYHIAQIAALKPGAIEATTTNNREKIPSTTSVTVETTPILDVSSSSDNNNNNDDLHRHDSSSIDENSAVTTKDNKEAAATTTKKNKHETERESLEMVVDPCEISYSNHPYNDDDVQAKDCDRSAFNSTEKDIDNEQQQNDDARTNSLKIQSQPAAESYDTTTTVVRRLPPGTMSILEKKKIAKPTSSLATESYDNNNSSSSDDHCPFSQEGKFRNSVAAESYDLLEEGKITTTAASSLIERRQSSIQKNSLSTPRKASMDQSIGAFSVSTRQSGTALSTSTMRDNSHTNDSYTNDVISDDAEINEYSTPFSNATSEINSNNNFECSQDFLVEAEAVEDVDRGSKVYATARPDPWWRRNQSWLAALTGVVLIGIILAITLPASAPDAPTSAPTTLGEGIRASMHDLVLSKYPQTDFSDHASAQSQAIQWTVDMKQQDQEWYTDERTLRHYSLVTLFLSTSDGYGKQKTPWRNHDGWIEENRNECEWYGIECDDNGFIVRLMLSDNNMKGQLPLELSLISRKLVRMDLSHNHLVGALPQEIGTLSLLQHLDLSNNDLTGSIPSSLGDATHLVSINLSNNDLNSVIPNAIGNLSKLESIDLGSNELIGSIPSEIGALDSIREINCQNNRLTYELPSEIGRLATLEALNLQNNDLLGPLPSEMGLLTTLRDLDMSENHLFFKIPVELYRNGALASLESLDLSNNLLSGMLYDEVKRVYDFGASWQKLTSLQLQGNYLQQELPPTSADLYSMPSLEVLDLSSNYITGSIPEGMMKLSTITMLNLSNNQLSGTVPEFLMELDRLNLLDLSENKLKGTLSSKIGKLSALNVLDLSNSAMSGSLPVELGSLSLLTTLHFSRSPRIEGKIPTEIGRLTQLESLDFSSNEMMSGSLPTELGELINLEYLDLSRNRFSGPIPNEYGSLTALTTLRMRTNLLNSTLPEIFANFTRLEHLSLAENKISGSFPAFISELSALTFLDFGSNLLKGTIPSEIGLLNSLTILRLWSNYLTSSIPSEIGNLRGLEILSLTGNPLSGTVPAEFANLDSINGLSLYATSLSGSIPSSLCENAPAPIIRVECDNVFCDCPSCLCGDQDDVSIPTDTPTAKPELLLTSSPTRIRPDDDSVPYCGTFQSIPETGSVFEEVSSVDGMAQVDFPFPFNWGGTMNITYVTIDRFGAVKMGSTNDTKKRDDCFQAITPALFLITFGPPQAIIGSLYFRASETFAVLSWEDTRPNDASNDPYRVNFQIVFHYASGNFEVRWGEGGYADTTYQMISGAEDTCTEGLRIGATGDPFQFGFIDNGQWPTNQCRLFRSNGEGFYNEIR